MDIPLTSDYKAEDIKNFLAELVRHHNEKEEKVRKILAKKYKEKAINRLEREIQYTLGDKGVFKRDFANNLFHLELSGNYPPTMDEEIGYEITINLTTGQVYFNIDPENIKLSIDDFLDGEEELDENESDETSEEVGTIQRNFGETEQNLMQLELDKYQEKNQKELEKNKNRLSELEEFLKDHKKKVLGIDYILRRFAREKGFEYITNHGFPIPEDKNQLKLGYTLS